MLGLIIKGHKQGPFLLLSSAAKARIRLGTRVPAAKSQYSSLLRGNVPCGNQCLSILRSCVFPTEAREVSRRRHIQNRSRVGMGIRRWSILYECHFLLRRVLTLEMLSFSLFLIKVC